ncbi:MAG TPA: exodeoxyribonuclease V subunit alpha [Nevskiaceae bacterium]
MNATVSERRLNEGLRAVDAALAAFLVRRFPGVTRRQADLAALVSHALADGSPCLPRAQVEARAASCGVEGPVPIEGNPLVSRDGHAPLVLDLDRLYLRRQWLMERDISAALRARLRPLPLDGASVARSLDRLFPRSDAPVEGPDWARAGAALAARSRIAVITGGPGTGKTTTVVRLLALLQEIAMRDDGSPLRIRIAAPTGKAAARLSEAIRGSMEENARPALHASASVCAQIPSSAQTLHRLLGTQRSSSRFRHDRSHPLLANVVVVDEASMVSMELMHALLEAVPETARLILVGDRNQLASVEPGNVLGALCDGADEPRYAADTCAYLLACGCGDVTATAGGAPAHANLLAQETVQLRTNWRSRDAPGIVALAAAINAGDASAAEALWQQHPLQLQRTSTATDWLRTVVLDGPHGLRQLVERVRTGRNPAESADAYALRHLARLREQQLLTALRHGPQGLEALNARIDASLRPAASRTGFFAGQALLVTTNLYDLGLMNGDVGLVLPEPLRGDGLRVAFPGGAPERPVRWVLPEQIEGHVQGAWAISVHQSQGSEYDRVLLVLPSIDSPVLTRELLYTAVTRARAHFTLIEGADRASAARLLAITIRRRSERASGLALRLRAVGE